jgi:predicted secreted protein
MVASAGRQVTFTWNGAAVLGVREKGISLNGEPINVTSDEDSGWRTLIPDVPNEDQVEVKLSGVSKDTRLKVDWFARTRTRAAVFTFPNGDVISGTFMIATFSEGVPYNNAITFEATLMSHGAVTFTPGT